MERVLVNKPNSSTQVKMLQDIEIDSGFNEELKLKKKTQKRSTTLWTRNLTKPKKKWYTLTKIMWTTRERELARQSRM